MDTPMFSVVIAVYNRAELVRATLDSVLSQQESDREVIVVDDGSTDDTPNVLAEYGDRIALLRQANRGPGAARNLALRHAKGQYIAFIDSDDLWPTWTLSTYRQVIEQHDRPAFVASREWSFTDTNTPPNLAKLSQTALRTSVYDDYYASHADGGWVPLCGAAVRSDVLRQVGWFAENRINFEETDLWLRLGVAPGFVRIESPVCSARREHKGSVTSDLDTTVAGVLYLIEQENTNQYPGGNARRIERLMMLTRHVRPVSIRCLRKRDVTGAWSLYRKSARWHLRLGRMRYLLGFVALTALAVCGGLRR